MLQRRRQHVQREQVPAGEVFKREQDEDERGDFQHPEGQQRHRVGQEELQQRRQHKGTNEGGQGIAAGGPNKIIPETKNENGQRHPGHHDERDTPGKKQAEPIPQIIHRLEQELADVAFTDVGGDLPVVLVDSGEDVHDGHHDVIKNHLRLGVAGERPAVAVRRVDRAPERQHGEQRDETEQRSRQIIEAIRQVALNPDADDVPVFFQRANFSRLSPGNATQNMFADLFPLR